KLNATIYKEFREKYNSHIKKNINNLETAALFIYLNKHCFNGLYRVNSKGFFNVPWNKKEYVASYNKENIIHIAKFLQNVKIKKNATIYKEFREKYNRHIKKNINNLETAALFIYLNKHCFNGLYRVNSKGFFNVPWNKKEYVASYNKENIIHIAKFLQNVKIKNEDFSLSVNNASKNDFIFFDSPYAPLNPSSFTAYDKAGFKVEEHERLANLFKDLDSKGVYC